MRVTKNNLLTDSNKKSRHTGRVSHVYHMIWVFQFLSHSGLKFVQKTNYKKLYEGIRFFKLDRKMAKQQIAISKNSRTILWTIPSGLFIYFLTKLVSSTLRTIVVKLLHSPTCSV